jgi:hypothetical protein
MTLCKEKGCTTAIDSRQNKTGRCRRHAAAHNARTRIANPEVREKLRQNGFASLDRLLSPETRAKTLSPESLAKRAKSVSDYRLPWCPEEYRDEYRKLRGSGWKRPSPDEARAIIEAKIANDRAIRSGDLDDAVFWLSRIAPIKRLDDGSYRYGHAVLSPGEVIKRAELKGWKARVAA